MRFEDAGGADWAPDGERGILADGDDVGSPPERAGRLPALLGVRLADKAAC